MRSERACVENHFLLNVTNVQISVAICIKIYTSKAVHAVRLRLRLRLVQAYLKTGTANFNCSLKSFKQQLAFEMRVHCGISIVFLKASL